MYSLLSGRQSWKVRRTLHCPHSSQNISSDLFYEENCASPEPLKPTKHLNCLNDALDFQAATFCHDFSNSMLQKLRSEVEATKDAGIEECALSVGDIAPDFSLPDINNVIVDSKSLRQEGPLVIIFYHGDWSPLCMLTLIVMQKHLQAIQEKGASLVAICPQSHEKAAMTAMKSGATFPLLSDEGNKVVKQFRLFHQLDCALPGNEDPWPLPMASTYIVDTDGKVAYSSVNCDPTKRAEPSDVLNAIPKTKTKLEVDTTKSKSRPKFLKRWRRKGGG